MSTVYKIGIYKNGAFDRNVSYSLDEALSFCETFVDMFSDCFDYYFRWCTDVDRVGDGIYGHGIHKLMKVLSIIDEHGEKTYHDCIVLGSFSPELLNDFMVGFGRVPTYEEMRKYESDRFLCENTYT